MPPRGRPATVAAERFDRITMKISSDIKRALLLAACSAGVEPHVIVERALRRDRAVRAHLGKEKGADRDS